jgi:hypothetical protein
MLVEWLRCASENIGFVLIKPTTFEGFSAADLLQKQQREIPDTIEDCRRLRRAAPRVRRIGGVFKLLPLIVWRLMRVSPTDDRERRLTICCAIATPI